MQSGNWLEWTMGRTWLIELLIVLCLLFVIQVFLKKILLRSKHRKELKEGDWRYHLDYAAITPARVLLWILLGAFIFDLAVREFKLTGFGYAATLRNAAIIFCLAWFLLRWKRVFHRVVIARTYAQAKGRMWMDPFTVEMVSKLFTILVIFITLLIVMSIFGLNIAPLVAFGGIGAATLGIAGKDVIANFFGGFMIYLTRPFLIGDHIELQQRHINGHVEEIGWYFTSIRDMHKKPLYIPNAVFSTEPLTNLSRMTHRRIEESIGIRYADLDKIPPIIEEAREMLERHTAVDHNQPIHLFLEKFGDTAILLEIKAYISRTRYEEFMGAKQEILSEIYRIIQKQGAEIACPTMEVRMQT